MQFVLHSFWFSTLISVCVDVLLCLAPYGDSLCKALRESGFANSLLCRLYVVFDAVKLYFPFSGIVYTI